MFLNDSACNLSSINLMKFRQAGRRVRRRRVQAAIRTLITAQEILVDNASYPTPSIEKEQPAYRPLGLGYATLSRCHVARAAYDSTPAATTRRRSPR